MKLKLGFFLMICMAFAGMAHADDVVGSSGSTGASVSWYNSFNYSCGQGCYGNFPSGSYSQNPFSFEVPAVFLPAGSTINSATLNLSGINNGTYTQCGYNSCNNVTDGGAFTSIDGIAINSGNATINLLDPVFASALSSIASGNPILIEGYTSASVGGAYNYTWTSTYTYGVPYQSCDSYGCSTYYNYYTGYNYYGSNSGTNYTNVIGTLSIDATETPEPGSLFLLGSGLVGTLGAGKRLLRKFRA